MLKKVAGFWLVAGELRGVSFWLSVEAEPKVIRGADWRVDKRSRKSTFCGAAMRGKHFFRRTWSTTGLGEQCRCDRVPDPTAQLQHRSSHVAAWRRRGVSNSEPSGSSMRLAVEKSAS